MIYSTSMNDQTMWNIQNPQMPLMNMPFWKHYSISKILLKDQNYNLKKRGRSVPYDDVKQSKHNTFLILINFIYFWNYTGLSLKVLTHLPMGNVAVFLNQ